MKIGHPLIGMMRWQGRPGANALALTHAAAMQAEHMKGCSTLAFAALLTAVAS